MLINLLQKNRSYRSYDEAHHVSRATLEELIDCTRYTASSVNMQPLKYFAANEPETVSRIQPLTHWAGKLKELHCRGKGTGPRHLLLSARIVLSVIPPRCFSAILASQRRQSCSPLRKRASAAA